MAVPQLPLIIERYFQIKEGAMPISVDEIFADSATVHDIGEDKVMSGLTEIGDWLGKIGGSGFKTELLGHETIDGSTVIHGVVSGDFPGSPYAFDYTFTDNQGKVHKLVIDPIGPVTS